MVGRFVVGGRIVDQEEFVIEDVANCAIRFIYGCQAELYLIIVTISGQTYFFQYGPVAPEIYTLPFKYNISFEKVQFKEEKIMKKVYKVLASTFNGFPIEAAQVIPIETAWDEFRDLKEYFTKVINNEVY